jgi:nicotinamidase-related amidase
MNRDLGVWTHDDCALVLIDYQKEQLESIRSETPADLIELHVRFLTRTARAFGVPIVLSTVGVAYGFNSPTQPAILAELPDIEPIDRSSMDSFEDQAFREAVAATGRKRLIFGGLQTEVCLALAVVEALKSGYEAQFVTDAVGSRSQIEHRTAIERLSRAGAVPNTAIGVFCELFRDWAGPLGPAAQELSGWYFREVPKVTDTVGIAEAEADRAQAAVAG